jgi:hypothetical protein
MKKLKKKRSNQQPGETSPDQWKKIRERASELAMNRGKRAREAGKEERQRAKREFLGMEIASPKV